MLLKEFVEKYGDYEVKEGFMDFLEKPKSKTVWDLKNRDEYYFLNNNGGICTYKWDNDSVDRDRRNKGFIFLSREEAKFENRRREVYTQVKRFAHEFSIDEWKNRSIYKFYPYYDCEDEVLRMSFDTFVTNNRLYFKSYEDIQKAIEAVGEENFIKYYMGVKK